MKNIYKDYYELQKKYRDVQVGIQDCLSFMYNMGGPLNDNILKYTNKQLMPFFKIANILKMLEDTPEE